MFDGKASGKGDTQDLIRARRKQWAVVTGWARLPVESNLLDLLLKDESTGARSQKFSEARKITRQYVRRENQEQQLVKR